MSENINMDETITKNVYPCDQCDYSGSRKALNRHKQSKHEGIKYPCDQCKYAATQQSDLNKHKQSKHQGMRYPVFICCHSAVGSEKAQRVQT